MKINLSVPTSLSDIKLSQYQKFLKVTKDNEDANFVNRQLVSIFCDVPEDVVGKIKSKDFNGVIETITKALKESPTFVTKFRLNGVDYGFIPKLDDITLDEQADLETLLKDTKDWARAMNVMYRPITTSNKGKYLIKEYEGDGKELDVNLEIALGAVTFFLNLQNDLLNYTLNYIKDQAVKTPKVLQTLEENGVGIRTITHLQEVILENSQAWAN
jgi:hypothetical protein